MKKSNQGLSVGFRANVKHDDPIVGLAHGGSGYDRLNFSGQLKLVDNGAVDSTDAQERHGNKRVATFQILEKGWPRGGPHQTPT